MYPADSLAGVRLRGDDGDVEVGMRRDEAQQLAARVPAGARYGGSRSHLHDYALHRNFMRHAGGGGGSGIYRL
jgi:hypothetical protein